MHCISYSDNITGIGQYSYYGAAKPTVNFMMEPC